MSRMNEGSVASVAPLVDDATALAFAAFRSSGRGAGFDPYYSQEIRRFELRDDDVLVAPGDARAVAAACGAALLSEHARARLEICGVSRAEAERALAAIDGIRSVQDARTAAGLDNAAWERILSAAFGSLVFAPAAVASLEQRLSGTEIVRFVGSPYEIVRSYWENMASIASRLERLAATGATADALASTDLFVAFLRELHVIALMGESGRSFYGPASPIFERESVGAGELLRAEPVLEERGEGTRFVSGPRVGAGLIGGAHYHALLADAVDDPGALAPARALADAAGLPWGRVATARADGDMQEAPWFCPPRPLVPAHFDALRAHLAEAWNAEAERAVPSLARFHWSFVRLHPFAFANQCVAMSLVNHVLRRALGAGMPHHVLDHLALRLSSTAYTRVFAAAVRGWVVRDDSPVRRTLELVSRKRRAFDFLGRLERAESIDAAGELVRERPDDALLVLLACERLRAARLGREEWRP